jgi:hypothetical protein
LGGVDSQSVNRRLKFEYLRVKNDHASKSLEVFTQLAAHLQKPQVSVTEMIQDACAVLQRQFRLRWVMIGLRESDGYYRYLVNSGMREDAWSKQRTKQYLLNDFELSTENYRAAEISKLTRSYLEEENPLGKNDEGVVNRPALLNARRRADDETLEADFLDTLITGPNGELLGWIEYSGTVTGKFPDAITIRHIEVAASLIASAILIHRFRL